MRPVSTNIEFETPVGIVVVFAHGEGWVFEFKSGWNNGLHCDVPFGSFDKCYSHLKGRMKEWKAEQKKEQQNH